MRQLSYSQLMTYVRCPEHYLFQYILGFRRQPRKVFKHGFSLHETLQYHFEEKQKNGKGITLPEAKEFYVYSFKNALEDYRQELSEVRPFLTREYLSKEYKTSVEDMVETGLRGLEVYFKQLNRHIDPDMVEEAFEFPVRPGIKMIGRIDLTHKNGTIHELKTTRISPNKQDIRSDAQLAIYQLGYRELTGRAPKGISKDYIVLSKKNSKLVRFRVVRPFINKKTMLQNINNIVDAMDKNIYYCLHPAESWLCSKEWCGYYKLHQEVKKVGLDAFLKKYAPRRLRKNRKGV